jgi:hypothetical protein
VRLRRGLPLLAAVLMACGSDGGAQSSKNRLSFIPQSWTVPAWFVDPQNSTTVANDSAPNTCTTIMDPCLTFSGISKRWGTNSPRLRQDTTITFLSSHTDDSDPVYLTPFIEAGALVVVQGTLGPAQLVATGTLSNVVPKNRPAGQLLQASLPGAAPGQLVVNTTRSSRAWVYKNAGTDFDWFLSQPLLPALVAGQPLPSSAEDDGWANGDAVSLYRPVAVDLAEAKPTFVDSVSSSNNLTFYHLAVLSPSAFSELALNASVYFIETSMSRVTRLGTAGAELLPAFVNVDFANDALLGFQDPYQHLNVIGGQIRVPAFFMDLRGGDLDDDFIVGGPQLTGNGLGLSGGAYGAVFVDTGMLFLVGSDTMTFPARSDPNSNVIWGPGTLTVLEKGMLQYPAGAGQAQRTFLQTGGFLLQGASTACAVDVPDSQAFRCGIPLTPVKLDTPVAAGGFGGLALFPGGASITNGTVPPPPVDGGAARDGGADAAPDAEAGIDAAAPMCAAPDAGSAPSGPAVCGDGWRDPATEECDDGLGAAPASGRACSAQCQALDELAVMPRPGASNTVGTTPLLVQTSVDVPSVATVAFSSPQAAGDLNVVFVGWNDSVSSVASVTDDGGNTYVPAVGPTVVVATDGSKNATQAVYYAKNIAASASNAVTVHFRGLAPSPDIRVLEYGGVDKTRPLDATAAASGNAADSESGALTTTGANDLIVAGNYVEFTTAGAGDGFTSRILTAGSNIAEDQIAASAGSHDATAPVNGGWWVMQAVAFRPSGTPAFVQGSSSIAGAQAVAISTLTAPFTAAQGVGDLNLVFVGWTDTTASVVSVTDTVGNAYALAAGPTELDGLGTQAVYYAKNIVGAAAGANAVTIKLSGPTPFGELRVLEYRGLEPNSPVDATAAATGTGVPASSTTVATTRADELLVVGNIVGSIVTGPSAGFTIRIDTSGDAVEDGPVAAAGSYTVDVPLESPSSWIQQTVALKLASSSAILSGVTRTLAAGRHPIAANDSSLAAAFLDTSAQPLALSMATFTGKGDATGTAIPLNVQSTVTEAANPVVAGLPCNRFAAAWSDYGGDGDSLGVAMRLVDPTTPPSGAPVFANTTAAFSQYDPDVVWTGTQLVVAWVDDSNAQTAPDVRVRTFDENLRPTSGEQTLAATSDSEADVALAAFAGSWAAAWRDDANGVETIRVHAGSADWTVGTFLPGPVDDKPALAQLDATHLLVAYSVGVDSTGSGVASGSKIQVAVLDTGIAGVQGVDLVAAAPEAQGLDQAQPNLAVVQGSVFAAWRTAASPGDANGEDVWLKPIPWNGITLDLTAAERPLPHWPQARAGDQRLPAMVAGTLPPGGGLFLAWDDLGKGIASGEGNGDVVVELAPVPLLRTAGDGGP